MADETPPEKPAKKAAAVTPILRNVQLGHPQYVGSADPNYPVQEVSTDNGKTWRVVGK